MNSRTKKSFLSREAIYEMLTKENEYAKGWDRKNPNSDVFPAHTVSRESGEPFTLIEWLNFAQKYLDEARLAHSNYCPDLATLRIRFIKAASLLVTALQVHGDETDLNIAGISSSTHYPVIHGGLAAYKASKEGQEEEKENG